MKTEPDLRPSLQEAWDWCATTGKPLALLSVTPDNPAAAQDAEVLDHLQRALRVHCARDRDVIVRPGLGTFLAVLPDTPPAGARHVGEQIVEAMHHAPHSNTTVSVGVAAVVPSSDSPSESLLTRANKALRAAQNQGGDRCAGCSTPAPTPEGPIQTLRKLFLPTPKQPDHQRRTD